MTLPVERYRAILNVRSFLGSLSDPKKTPRMTAQLRRDARNHLKHYPSVYELERISKKSQELLEPSDSLPVVYSNSELVRPLIASITRSRVLKIKAAIYRYTGLFLADREELEYMNSDLFWQQFSLIADEHEESYQFINHMLVGIWQGYHGFYRGIWTYQIKHQNPLTAFIGWFVVFYQSLKFDVTRFMHFVGAKLKSCQSSHRHSKIKKSVKKSAAKKTPAKVSRGVACEKMVIRKATNRRKRSSTN